MPKKHKVISHIRLAKRVGVRSTVVQAIFNQILIAVACDRTVNIRGFGLFKKRIWPGRKIRTPVFSKKKDLVFGPTLGIHHRASRSARIHLELMAEQYARGINPETGKKFKDKTNKKGREAVPPPPLLGQKKAKKKAAKKAGKES
jgi:nucleoid DNA-binding protein